MEVNDSAEFASCFIAKATIDTASGCFLPQKRGVGMSDLRIVEKLGNLVEDLDIRLVRVVESGGVNQNDLAPRNLKGIGGCDLRCARGKIV